MLFWIFEGVCFGLPILALIIHICKTVQEDHEAARKAAEKAKATEEKRLLAEKKKAEKDAERAQKQQEKEAARRPVGRPRKQQATPPADAESARAEFNTFQRTPTHTCVRMRVESMLESKTANVRAFEGQHVAFTGTLPGMTRKEAIAAVAERGGHAYYSMPACTTILVVGDIRGDGSTEKLEKADEWIGQVRKITAAEFMAMLHEDAEQEMSFEQFTAAFVA